MRKTVWTLFLFAAFACPLRAEVCADWESANGLGNLNLRAVTFNDEELVAGGDTGIATSEDGYRWVTRHRGESLNIQGMASNGTTAVAVGYYAIRASDDNREWTEVYYNAGHFFWDVTWNGSKFVAVGNAIVGQSTDGHSWTVASLVVGSYYSVIWDGSQFIAAGARNGGSIATSPDGTTWTEVTIGQAYFQGVASSGTLAVAIKPGGVATRSGGGAWVEQTITGFSEFTAIFWTGTRFIASAHVDSIAGRGAVASTDGVNWTLLEAMPADISAFTFAHTLIHLPEEPGPSRRIAAISLTGAAALNGGFFAWSDTDGDSWTQLYLGMRYVYGNRYIALTKAGDRFIALTENHLRHPHVSWDGVHWITPLTFTTTSLLHNLVWNGSVALAIGSSTAVTSTDGLTWTESAMGAPSEGFRDAVWDGNRFVAGGSGVRTSVDGVVWSPSVPPFGSEKYAMAWNGSRYVLVGDQIWTSTDAANWTNVLPNATLSDIAWNGEVFCAVGVNILTSPDGITWTTAPNPDSRSRIYWTGSEFIAWGGGASYSASPNGTDWTTHPLPTDDFPGISSIVTIEADQDQILFVTDGLAGLTLLRTNCSEPRGPILDSITPHGGLVSGGTSVTLRGRNFPAGSVVRFSGVDAQITFWSPTMITAVSPAMNAGSVEVTVGAIGEQAGRLHEAFRYVLPPPEVSGVQPAQGPLAGGTLLTITGQNFVEGATVTVGGAAATDVDVTNGTTVTAVTPAGAGGAADVVVTNPDAQSTSPAGAFTYVDPTIAFTPTSQPATPGATRTATLTLSYPQQSITNVALASTRSAIAAVAGSIAIPAGASFVDVTLTAGLPGTATITATLPPLAGSATADTSLAVAFTDSTLAGKVVKAAHVLELRRAVNALRVEGNLPPFSFADATLNAVKIKAVHLTELRTALNAARTARGWPALTFSNTIQSGVTRIRAVDLTELRNGLAQ